MSAFWTQQASTLRNLINLCERSPPRNTAHRFAAYAFEHFWNEFWFGWTGTRDNATMASRKPSFDMTFVNCTLTSPQKKEFEALYTTDAGELHREFALVIGTGHKVSATWDDENQCYIVSAMGKAEDHRNYGKCLTARSDDLYEAMALLAYKHHHLFKDGTWAVDTKAKQWG